MVGEEMKYGICEWSLPVSGTLAIRLAGEAGYDGIQLGEAGGRQMGYPLTHPRVQELYIETAQRFGIELHSLNLGALLAEGTLNYAAETLQGQYAKESLQKGFKVCRELGIGTIVITVNSEDEEQTSNVLSHLKYAVQLATENNVEIAVESAQELSVILGILECMQDEVKICMDILNPLRFGSGNPREQICIFGKERISHFHMKDSKKELFRIGERGCTLLGTGDAGYEESVDLIRKMRYEGWVISENYYYLPPMFTEDADFIALARKDLRTMRESFGEI